LLGMETLLLGGTVAVWVSTYHPSGSFGRDAIIALLAISMGLQVIIGKRLNLSNIPTVVFTSTLTNIVIGFTELMANRNLKFPMDTKRQCGAFMLYFTGALTAGLCLHFNLEPDSKSPGPCIIPAQTPEHQEAERQHDPGAR